MKTHDDIRSDLAALALGTLEPEERRETDEHLESGCLTCREELAEWREVVGVLPLATDDAPAPNLKARVLERARGERRSARVVRPPRWWTVPAVAAAVAVLAVGGLLYERAQTIATLRSDLADARQSFDRLSGALAASERDTASLRAALAAARAAAEVVQGRGLHFVQLRETPEASPGEAHALLSRDSGKALFYAFDLPQVPADRTYELWWITDEQGPINAGLFLPDRNGLGKVQARIPADIGAIRAAAVTIEPAGGVAKPTGPMVLVGSVESEKRG